MKRLALVRNIFSFLIFIVFAERKKNAMDVITLDPSLEISFSAFASTVRRIFPNILRHVARYMDTRLCYGRRRGFRARLGAVFPVEISELHILEGRISLFARTTMACLSVATRRPFRILFGTDLKRRARRKLARGLLSPRRESRKRDCTSEAPPDVPFSRDALKAM